MHVHEIVNKTVSNSMVMKDMMTLCQTSIGAHHDCFTIHAVLCMLAIFTKYSPIGWEILVTFSLASNEVIWKFIKNK